MIPFHIAIEQYRGSSYDIGYYQGEQMNKSLIKMFSKIINEDAIDLAALNDIYSSYAPHLLEELRGIAAAMNIPFKKAALLAGYGTPEIQGMGCSSVINNKMLVRNYDFSPELYDARFVLTQPNEGYASAGHSLHAIGRTEGVNEKGLAVALHFVNNNESRNGLTASSVIRILLDTCKNTADAVNLIKQLPHAWSYNFSIGDSCGHTVVVEESPYDIKVRENKEMLFCTNHFQNDDMSGLNRIYIDHSRERLNYLINRHFSNASAKEVFNVFHDVATPLYNGAYSEFFGTLHTFAYIFEESRIITAIPNGDVLEIDFKAWLKGDNMTQNKLTGYLTNA